MREFCAVLLTASGLFACAAPAQVTNVPPTELEAFEAQTGTVIVKGAGQIGSLAAGALNITVFSKESLDVSTGRKEYGMMIQMVANNQQEWRRVVDYDELDSFLSGLDYLARIDYNVTTLPTFVAGYTTKSGFRVGAFTNQRRGAIQFFLQAYNAESPRVLISPAQLAQFQTLIEQTRKNLDALRTPR
ncbi:MAG: hypothetical protein ABSA45_13490 [Verrucomicrobiota bacterium]|jgi:hypothetical protein